MRGRLLNMPAIGRAVGFALVAIAIVAAALHFRTSESHVQGLNVSPAAASDPLADGTPAVSGARHTSEG